MFDNLYQDNSRTSKPVATAQLCLFVHCFMQCWTEC